MRQINFDVYGCRIELCSNDVDLSQLKLLQDFNYFSTPHKPDPHIRITINLAHHFLREGFKIFKTPMCEVRQLSFSKRQMLYAQNNIIIAALYDSGTTQNRHCQINVSNLKILDDILYFYVNSACGEFLDSTGIMRLHAFSCSINDEGVIVFGHVGAGKSTLALAVLDNCQWPIYSDELTLVVNFTEVVLPFPIRISKVDESNITKDETKFNYFFKSKKLMPIPVNKIAKAAQLNKIFYLSKYSLPSFVKISFEVLLGIGLIQMLEFFLRLNNLPTLIKIIFNRLQLIRILKNKSLKLLPYQLSIDEKLLLLGKTN